MRKTRVILALKAQAEADREKALMANMDYWRFEEAYQHLEDFQGALREKEFDKFSATERNWAIDLVRLCKRISDEFIDEVEKIKN
jgi:hypothetical protein